MMNEAQANKIEELAEMMKLAAETDKLKTEGKKFDDKKPDLSLIPSAAQLEEAYVWTAGKKKYNAYNWHKGIAYSRILGAMERHIALLKAGLDTDYENGRHHAAAIRCGCAMLIQFALEDRTELDDRMKLDEETKRLIEEMTKGEFVWDLEGNGTT